MDMKFWKILLPMFLLALLPTSAQAWDIKDLLNKGREAASQTGKDANKDLSGLGNLIEGVFTRSKLEVKDLEGTWTVTGSAVNFKSENLLKQVGGRTGATLIEKKLDPWYKRLGMTNGTLTVDKEGNFTLQLKKLKLTGTITKAADVKDDGKEEAKGNFIFHINKFGKTDGMQCEAFVTKGVKQLDVMFDVSRLQQIMEGVASFSKLKLASTLSSLLSSYDGICVGFALKK